MKPEATEMERKWGILALMLSAVLQGGPASAGTAAGGQENGLFREELLPIDEGSVCECNSCLTYSGNEGLRLGYAPGRTAARTVPTEVRTLRSILCSWYACLAYFLIFGSGLLLFCTRGWQPTLNALISGMSGFSGSLYSLSVKLKRYSDLISFRMFGRLFPDEAASLKDYPYRISDGRRILLVESNPLLRRSMQRSLSVFFLVETASGGREAAEKSEHTPFDMVITEDRMKADADLPLCSFLKRRTQSSDIPIIVLSSGEVADQRIAGYRQGADSLLLKPFSKELLLWRIANIFEERERLREAIENSSLTVRIASPSLSPEKDRFMERTVAAVGAHIDDSDFDLEALAGEMHVSRSTLYRRVKEATGMTVNNFIKDVKLKIARKMMEEGEDNVKHAAFATGFESPKYFTQLFKKKYGVTPSDFILQRQRLAESR